MHIDIDEFLVVYGDLIGYLNNNYSIGNFKIKRFDFSGNNHLTKPKNVLTSYNYREKISYSHKSIGRKDNIVKLKNINKSIKILDTHAEENYIASCHEFFTNLKIYIFQIIFVK